jgi:hypothetical protein
MLNMPQDAAAELGLPSCHSNNRTTWGGVKQQTRHWLPDPLTLATGGTALVSSTGSAGTFAPATVQQQFLAPADQTAEAEAR